LIALLALACSAPALASGDHGDEVARTQRIFTDLQGRFGTVALVAAIGLAIAWGAGHALTPGHGKALVGAYLIQSRGRYFDAVWLGLIVTLTHTLSVIVLGVIFAWVLRSEGGREDVLFYLELASVGLVIAFGFWLLVSRTLFLARETSANPGGHHDPHPHPHPHDHRGHPHPHVSDEQLARFARGYRHPNAKVRLGELLALGVSGGIVPCPSALVIVLLGLHFRAAWTAVLLVLAFSLGLAAVLVAIGCALVSGGKLAARSSRATIWLKVAPVVSAVVILLLGLCMAGGSFARHGLLRFDQDHWRAHFTWSRPG
jgi:ABC-type nickel/cobalt efflux system permease component RcnA